MAIACLHERSLSKIAICLKRCNLSGLSILFGSDLLSGHSNTSGMTFARTNVFLVNANLPVSLLLHGHEYLYSVRTAVPFPNSV